MIASLIGVIVLFALWVAAYFYAIGNDPRWPDE